MTRNPRLSDETIRRAHVGGFVDAPLKPASAPSPVRIILVGIIGPPQRWKPVYTATEEVCRPMIFPFSPDQSEKDKTVCGNVIEYAQVASDLKGSVIAGDPTMVFCMPGIDRNRRIGLFAEMLPRVLSHHHIHGSLLYFGQDHDDLFTGIMEAQMRGFTTHKLGETVDDFDKEDFQEWWAQWLVDLDPMKDQQ
jgi:hypothetical protein